MNVFLRYLIIIISSLAMFSCAEDKVPTIKEVNATISLKLKDFTGDLENPLTVKLVNSTGFEIIETEEREVKSVNKEIEFTNLAPGTYTISVSGKLTEKESSDIFNIQSEVILKGSKNQIRVYDYTSNKFELELEPSTTSALIFKEIFYSGSKYPKEVGGLQNYFYEQFYEIYNNSDEVVYLDSLFIADIYPTASSVALPFPNDLNKDNLFGISVWMIDGKGTDVPLDPGKSIVITMSGRNHKDVHESLLDLSSADYEAYVEKIGGKEPLDYPVPNLTRVYWEQRSTVNQWLTAVAGPAMVIYKLPYAFDSEDKYKPEGASATSNPFVRIPKSAVIDAVEAVKQEDQIKNKRLPATLDAGYVLIEGTYTGKSVARKELSRTSDGRIIFQDTNNSSEDFEIMDSPEIRRYLKDKK